MEERTKQNEVLAPPPVHVVYGGAHLFKADLTEKLGRLARRALDEYAPDEEAFAEVFGVDHHLRALVAAKLEREPVEDYRIDFEDGFGWRTETEEYETAAQAAREMARAQSLPRWCGIRIKPLTPEWRDRSLRTLDRFLTVLSETAGRVPDRFLVTLPKVGSREEVDRLEAALGAFESALRLAEGAVRYELMVETPFAVRSLCQLLDAAGPRLEALHFGAYDYCSALGIAGARQDLGHPACLHARQILLLEAAGSGVRLADGATTQFPVPVHRGDALSVIERAANRDAVGAAWRKHSEDIRRSLSEGFYQSWDLHPAQLVSRYAAVYSFFRETLASDAARLKNFFSQASRATLMGSAFDDAATAQGLLGALRQAIACGAVEQEDAAALSGLAVEDLRSGSFHEVVARVSARTEQSP
jgi:citrate lyase beta subunit